MGGTTSTLTLSNGFIADAPNSALGSTEFIGFVSTDLITSLRLLSNNDDYVVLDFILASAPAAIPEPSALAILSTALIGLGLALQSPARRCIRLARRGNLFEAVLILALAAKRRSPGAGGGTR
jgi:hypothetical protein